MCVDVAALFLFNQLKQSLANNRKVLRSSFGCLNAERSDIKQLQSIMLVDYNDYDYDYDYVGL